MNQYDFNPYECQCDYFDDSYGTSTTASTSTNSTATTNSTGNITAPHFSQQQKPKETLESLCKQKNEELKNSGMNITQAEVDNAKGFVSNILSGISNGTYSKKFEEVSDVNKIPKKTVAKNFFTRILGTIADVLGIAVGTIENVAVTVIQVLSQLLISGVHLLCRVVRNLVSIVTLNKTASNC